MRRFSLLLLLCCVSQVARAQDDAGIDVDEAFAAPPPEVEHPAPAPAPAPAQAPAFAPDDALFQVDAVDVVGHLDEHAVTAPGSVYVLDEKRLSVFRQDDATQILSQVPGVYVRQEDGFGLRPNIGMRGADVDRSKKVTLLEDGLLFGPAPYSAPAAYYFPLMMRMTGVEVFKGASAIRYGPQTIGGGIDLRTRDVPDQGGLAAVDAAFGSYYYTKAHAYGGYGTKHAGFLAEGASVSSNGFKHIDGGGDTGFSKQEFMLKGRLNTDPDGHVFQRLIMKAGYAREDSNETYLGLSDRDFRRDPTRRYRTTKLDGMEWWRSQGELLYTLGVGDHFQLDSALYRHDFQRVWKRVDSLIDTAGGSPPGLLDVLRNPTGRYFDVLSGQADSESEQLGILQAGNERKFVSQGIQSIARGNFVTGAFSHAFELGVRVHQDEIRRHHRAYGYLLAPERNLPSGPLVLVDDRVDRPDLAHNEVNSLAVALHLAYDVTWRNLTLSPGVRGEIIRATYTEKNGGSAGQKLKGDSQTALFALGARYALGEAISLIGGIQQGMTPVAPDPGNTTSEPERALNYELGVRYADANGTFSFISFVSDYDRVVAPCDEQCASSMTGTYAGGRALITGTEVGGDYTVKLPSALTLPVRLAYTYTYAEFSDEFETDYVIWGGGDGRVDGGDLMPYVPPHQASFGSGLHFQERAGFDAQVTFMDRMREEAGQGALQTGRYTDRFALLDLTVFWQALEKLRLYVKGDNLTNNQPIVSRRPFGARPNKPLLIQGGFVWTM